MSRSVEMLKAVPALIMSLPSNDPDLAIAARDGGADLLKAYIRSYEHSQVTAEESFEEI